MTVDGTTMPTAGHGHAESEHPLLAIDRVTKLFGPLVACDDISFEVRPGEVMGLLGQNGAGKSTLMKVVVGVETADRGRVVVDGTALAPGDPAVAARSGVGMVHQHFSLVSSLTVWQNVLLGDAERFSPRRAIGLVESIGERFGIEVDPMARVEDLSAGMRQRVEIIKCLRSDPKVIILDEPTSVLTQAESVRLFTVLRSMVDDHGYAAVLISHRLSEILAATDRVTVLRSGAVVASMPTVETDAPSLASFMLGRDVALDREGAALGLGDVDEAFDADIERQAEIDRSLEIDSLTVHSDDGHRLLDEFSLSVRRGEIVGLAGVEGNGQSVLVEVLSGLIPGGTGSVSIAGADCGEGVPADLSALGVVPAERHDSGCVLDMSIAENLVLNHLDSVTRSSVIDREAIDANARMLVEEFDVMCSDVHAPMWTLSGGNQQKVVLARELSRRPDFIIAEQPTRGLDVGAMEYLWHRLRLAASEGAGILLVSTELDEILALADRVAVIFRGAVVGEMLRADVDLGRLGLLMGGETE
ncbi:MAG: ABC transporter ATP-binding protein [Acidimicrobiales bacterium]|nr:ABC transporter ATP-binding protein [Acidimicrobiales bacterium]